jgi:DNA mismatch endonuclease (patch repair protein)
MPDNMTPEERSERMSRVRNKDSKAEMRVRRVVHGMGFRYRLHNKTLPGKPDIVLTRHKKVILIHGCFWHQHGVCRPLSVPEHNSDFWRKKFADNVERDRRNIRRLQDLGWQVLVVWECETKDSGALESKLRAFLDFPPRSVIEPRRSG